MDGRSSGILLPVFSLPGPYGIGTMGKEARSFIDFLTADDLPILGCVPTAEAFKRGASFNRPVSEVQPGGRAADAIEGILDKVEAML